MVPRDCCGGSRGELLGELALELGSGTKNVNRGEVRGRVCWENRWGLGSVCNFCCHGRLLRWSCGGKFLLSVPLWPLRVFLQPR